MGRVSESGKIMLENYIDKKNYSYCNILKIENCSLHDYDVKHTDNNGDYSSW